MFKRLIRNTLRIAAIGLGTLALVVVLVFAVRWARRPSPYSAEGLLAHADDLAWNNNWVAAFPVYLRAEQAFEAKGDRGHALYAHVSQFAVRMETGDLPGLIAELNRDLSLPAARQSEVRLRVLEMKAKCEEEYDSGLAKQTFAEVERLALQQHRFYLASRASGEEGILAFMTGNLAEATRRVKRAYVIARYFGDPAAQVRYAEILGRGIQQLGRPKQALVFLDEAIATQKAHPEVALPNIAYDAKIDVLADLGKYREALQLADEALVLPRTYQFYGQLQSLLTSRSDVLAKASRNNEAISGYEEALADAKKLRSWRAINNIDAKLALTYEQTGALREALSAINDAIEANTQTPGEMFLVPGNLAVKARIQAELGRRADAERLYAKGADVLRALLTHVPSPEAERQLLGEVGDLYSGYFQLLSDEGRYADAFGVIEQAHGRIEAQQLEFDQTAAPRSPTHEEMVVQQLEVSLLHADAPASRTSILQQILASKQSETDQKTEETPVSLKALQLQLHPEELLIEYVLASQKSYALTVTHSEVNRYILPERIEIEKDVAQYRDRLQKQRTDVYLGRRLFSKLLGFTRDYPHAKSLIVVSDGALHVLPFSALIDDSGRFLLETKSVSAVPSGTVLSLLRNRIKAASVSRPYLGVAPWVDNGKEKPWVLRAISSSSKVSEVPPLPDSRDEVESIAAIAPRPSTVLIGSEATKGNFERLPLGDYRIMHFALHGVVDPVFPDRSALLFAPSKGDDGHLAARDIRQLRLHADLVTLSACDTGAGPVGVSGIESLDAAFIEAGASSVVSTLWDLQDRSGDKFMKAFYQHLKQESKADALRDAKLDLLHAGSAPYYWAGYELVGEPNGTPFTTE